MSIIRVKPPGGTWENLGDERWRGVRPETLQCSADRWGPATASFTLKRPIDERHPDLDAYSQVQVEVDGRTVWGGRITDGPGTTDGVTVQAEGAQAYLDDDRLERTWVHTRLQDWQDLRSAPGAVQDIDGQAAGVITTGEGVCVFGWSRDTRFGYSTYPVIGAYLDLGPVSGEVKRVSIDYKVWSTFGWLYDGTYFLVLDSADAPYFGVTYSAGIVESFTSLGGAGAAGSRSMTFATVRRYLRMYLYYPVGAGGTPPGEFASPTDLSIQITGARAYRLAAYESGHQSTLTVPTVLADALAYAPKLAQDGLGIENPGVTLPDFDTAGGYQTPREIWERVDHYAPRTKKVDAGFRPIYRARTVAPQLTVTNPEAFQDTSSGAAHELFNRVVMTGVDAAGTPLRVDRLASQIPGFVPSLLDRAEDIRTQELTVGRPATTVILQLLADAWLTDHRSTLLTGDVIATVGTVRWLLSGAPLTPAELLIHTDEPVLFAELIDPDTGAKGRVGYIDSVDWDEPSDVATVHVTNTRSEANARNWEISGR